MNFNKMNIPVFTGIDALDKISKDQKEIYLSAVEIGIPCLIANGRISDLSGIPFENIDLQEEFGKYSAHIQNCNAVVFGRLVPEVENNFEDDLYEFSFANRLHKKGDFAANKQIRCRLIVEDFCSTISESMRFEHRNQILKSITNMVKKENESMRIELQTNMKMDTLDKKTAIDFILENAKKGQSTLIYFNEAKYVQKACTLEECKAFYLDPHEEFELEIGDKTLITYDDYVTKKKITAMSEIKVNYDGSQITVPYYGKKQSTNIALLKLIDEGIITKLKIRAVQIDGTLKYCIA